MTNQETVTPESFNASIRALIEATRTASLGDLPELADLQRDIDALTAKVNEAHVPGERFQVSLDDTLIENGLPAPTRSLEDVAAFFPYSPVVGPLNPISPLATLSVVDGGIEGEVTLDSAFNGPPGSAHGGIVALIHDELLGCACLAADASGFTGTLSIRYEQRTPLDTPLQLRAWVDRVEGRKTFAVGEIRLGDTVLSRAEGIFIGMPKD